MTEAAVQPSGEGRGVRAGWAYLLAGTFLLLTPLTVFLVYAGYPLLAPEVLLSVLIVACIGLACGALMAIGGPWIRIAIATALIFLVVDFQTDWISSIGLRRASIVVVAIAAACWLLRAHLGQVLALVSGITFATSLFGASSPPWRVEGEAGEPRTDRGPYVQIILDEHIGIEGIPAEFDPGGKLAARVRAGFENRGFTVFTRAYSRYYNTGRSIPAALNFAAPGDANPFVENANIEPGQLLANATVSVLRERGYRLHAVQSDFLDLCSISHESVVDECASYEVSTIRSIEDLPIGAWAKAVMILDIFRGLSEIDGRIRSALGWEGVRRISSVSAMRASDAIVSMLEQARPGDAYLIHLMFPHFPFTYDAECELLPQPSWMNGYESSVAPRRNTPESRRIRYPLYLAQLDCGQKVVSRMLDALVAAGVYDQATIVIHGDHGSRIDTGPIAEPYVADLPAQDFVDGFSTLFAVKLPGSPGGADRRVLPLEELLGAVVRDQRLPPESTPEEPWIWIAGPNDEMKRYPLPAFADGRVETAPPR